MQKEQKQTVTVMGVGISSIMIALKLYEAGYKVAVYTKGPDPRLDSNIEQYGSTGNGKMGRFITGFEGEPYLSDTPMYPNMRWAFQNPLSEGGWLGKPLTEFSSKDQAWLQKRYEATFDQQAVQRLFEDYYIKNNKRSIFLWKELLSNKPNLFKNTDITNPEEGVLRFYGNQKLFKAAVLSHEKYKFLKEVLSVKEIKERFPAYNNAYLEDTISGGLIAEGFSLNIIQFVDNVINYLENSDVKFFWNTEVKKIEVDKHGIVHGLRTQEGQIIISDHYSINPGAYGIDILENTLVAGKIGGVAGRWLIMSRPEGHDKPTKIHIERRLGFPVGDNNLTPFMDGEKRMIAVGGGYVYVGSNVAEYPNFQSAYDTIDSEHERMMNLYFGDFYKSAKEKGEVSIWNNACVRSFTYDDKPIHEIMKTSLGGYLTITAGTNTGTATLAPYLAEWTLDALRGIYNV